jgi:dUTP pyrophosphatase
MSNRYQPSFDHRFMNIPVSWQRFDPRAIMPVYKSLGAAGADIRVPGLISIQPGGKSLVDLGWGVAVPEGMELQIRPRSGLSIPFPNYIANSPGTIDSDYRGPVTLIIHNTSTERNMVFDRGDRIAQAVLSPVFRMGMTEVERLNETERGHGGFGSTGVA